MATRPAGRRDPRPPPSRAAGDLHHRPQRELHQRVCRTLQLLRVLPHGRAVPTATCCRARSCSPRSTRRSSVGGNQLLLQGGHNPDLPLAWYEDLFRAVKATYPTFRLHALSPPEILHISRMSKLPVPEVVARLIAAGLDSVPGGGAEILVDRVRKLLNCYGKATADEWLAVMREVHLQGLRTTATMMYGSVETPDERIEHMMRLRALQDETRRFHGVHHVELPARSHRTGRRRADGRGVPAHARPRPHRAGQLRQPAGLVGDPGRQGRAAEPGVRRQRHGQRHDRGERRPGRGRELLHGRSRDRPQHRERRLHAHASHDALRPGGAAGLPRARRPASPVARRREEGRRRADACRTGGLRSAQPRGPRAARRETSR